MQDHRPEPYSIAGRPRRSHLINERDKDVDRRRKSARRSSFTRSSSDSSPRNHTQEKRIDRDHDYRHSRSNKHTSSRSRSPYRNRNDIRTSPLKKNLSPRRRLDEPLDDASAVERRAKRQRSSSEPREDIRDRSLRYSPDGYHSPSPSKRHDLSGASQPRIDRPSRAPESRSSRHRHHHSRERHRSSKHRKHNGRSRSLPVAQSPSRRSHAPLPSQQDAFASKSHPQASNSMVPSRPPAPYSSPPKRNPNYAPTGLLAAETNTVTRTSIILKYNEPPSARLPSSNSPWRLYIFKKSAHLSTLLLYERSCWLFGRERLVADVHIEHPSCSGQHAVVQFQHTDVGGEAKVRPYVIDLESANGTIVNGERIPESRYVELKSQDVLKFGHSEREYVILLPPKG